MASGENNGGIILVEDICEKVLFEIIPSSIPKDLLEQQIISNITEKYQTFFSSNNKIPTAKERVQLIVDALKFATNWVTTNTALHYYNGQFYKQLSEKQFCGLLGELIPKTAFKILDLSERKKIYETLFCDMIHITIKYNMILDTQNIIGVQNGVYNYKTYEFTSFDPKYHISSLLTKSYDLTKDCPKFKQHLLRSLPKKEDRDFLLSYLAYCLTNSIEYQCSLFLVGDGHNGKSIISDILYLLLGSNKCAKSSFEKVVNEGRFDNTNLEFATVCVCPEISTDEASPANCNKFKDQITNKTIAIEHKGVDHYDVTRKCKYIFDANNLPKITLAKKMPFYRRVRILQFLHIIAQKDRIYGYDQILYDEEGDGILTYIMSYLPKMDEYLKEKQDTWKIMESIWEGCIDPTRTFMDTYLTISSEIISFEQLYKIYSIYMDYYGYDVKKSNAFARQLKANAYESFRKSEGMNYNIKIAQEIYDLLQYIELERDRIKENEEKRHKQEIEIIEINEEE
jgi:putative DNA primase/helicase